MEKRNRISERPWAGFGTSAYELYSVAGKEVSEERKDCELVLQIPNIALYFDDGDQIFAASKVENQVDSLRLRIVGEDEAI
ncbi:hypothetical protein NDU88_004582 [Pleurodeles waltl]|uniref:Uncharacterized protein n=1 Tax=Pleurodeles waltl TaxID=8319 RepID=A0AAV7TUK8_PLEWA|nr:hypothetical protein NDU88_004582 [Pleurodeles waltl]